MFISFPVSLNFWGRAFLFSLYRSSGRVGSEMTSTRTGRFQLPADIPARMPRKNSSFYYVSGFIGYLILAHYLVKYPLQWSWRKTLAIGIPMFVTGYAITFGGYLIMQEYFPGNYAYLEIVWLFGGINVFMMTFPVFVCIQKLKIPSSPVLSKVASMTFGIYLCHFVFVQMGYDLFASLLPQGIPAIIHIICMAVTAFLISYLVVRGMYACKWTRRFVA